LDAILLLRLRLFGDLQLCYCGRPVAGHDPSRASIAGLNPAVFGPTFSSIYRMDYIG